MKKKSFNMGKSVYNNKKNINYVYIFKRYA